MDKNNSYKRVIRALRKQSEQRNQVDTDVSVAEKVSDWIADLGMKDNGKLFWKSTKDKDLAPVSYGDLRKLMILINTVQALGNAE